jgi:hypothetical protein
LGPQSDFQIDRQKVKLTKENNSADPLNASTLFATKEKDYGDTYKKDLLEQYKLCAEMADRISARRSLANNFFLSLNTLLVTIIGILPKIDPASVNFTYAWAIIASIAGILFCLLWSAIIRCYRDLNTAKFKVINEIEKKLPVAAFQTEWNCLNCINPSKSNGKYPQLTKIEYWVPVLFGALYALLIILISIFFASGQFATAI